MIDGGSKKKLRFISAPNVRGRRKGRGARRSGANLAHICYNFFGHKTLIDCLIRKKRMRKKWRRKKWSRKKRRRKKRRRKKRRRKKRRRKKRRRK